MTIAAGDLVAVRWSGEGTQRGPILGRPPSQRRVAISGTNIYRIVCGRIIGVGLLQQSVVHHALRSASMATLHAHEGGTGPGEINVMLRC